MFLLGPDWNDKTFEVQWEEHRQSHPVIPALPVLTDSPILVSRGRFCIFLNDLIINLLIIFCWYYYFFR